MSLEALMWAVDLPLTVCSPRAFRVLAKLAERADRYGYGAYPSVSTMATQLECSHRTVQRALAELLDLGLIRPSTVEPRTRADRRPRAYDVVTPALTLRERFAAITEPEDDDPARSRGDTYVTP